MTLTQLEIFSLVAELQGFTSAAHRLGISQSAVSHAIKALEQELGVELFRRHQTAVELSEIGAQLLGRARAMLGLANSLQQEAADARGMKRGTLRIGSVGGAGRGACGHHAPPARSGVGPAAPMATPHNASRYVPARRPAQPHSNHRPD